MVPASSHKVSRVSWYSGYRRVISVFAYGAFTLSGRLFHNRSANLDESLTRSEPRNARIPVWALSISLAATLEITFVFFSSGYLDVSVHRVPSPWLWIHHAVTEVSSAGFPHSDICGSRLICSSPQLFAAYHVFLRLSVPRHPPCALFCLTNRLAAGCLICIPAGSSPATDSSAADIPSCMERANPSAPKLFASSVTLLWLFLLCCFLSKTFVLASDVLYISFVCKL